jgi:ketosteroid isomerase-like protein
MDMREQLVRRAFEVFSRRDVEAFLELVSEDVEFMPTGTAAIARSGRPYRGHEGVRLYFDDVARVWQELELIPQVFRTEEEHLVVSGRVYARAHDGLLVDAPASWIWRFRDDLIVWWSASSSQDEALGAAGLRT